MVLCFLIVCTAVFPLVYKMFGKAEVYDFAEFDKEIEAFRASGQVKPAYSYKQLKDEVEDAELKATYFEFDPNGLPVVLWRKLGLSDRQIKVLKNYESKGGKFYRKEDVQKMYSISAVEYALLEPYIVIKSNYPDRKFKDGKEGQFSKKGQYLADKPAIVVELNAADSTSLETIRGIGPAFSSRIVRYKNRLGGFYRKEQLREIYGMDSIKYAELADQVKVDASAIQKINVNTATFDELKKHPYLSYKQMNAIIQYRKQHGGYTSITDLKKVAILNEATLSKIEPYLSY